MASRPWRNAGVFRSLGEGGQELRRLPVSQVPRAPARGAPLLGFRSQLEDDRIVGVGQQTRASGSSRQGNRPSKRSVVINGSIELKAHAHMPPDTIRQILSRYADLESGRALPTTHYSMISTRTAVPILSTIFPPYRTYVQHYISIRILVIF